VVIPIAIGMAYVPIDFKKNTHCRVVKLADIPSCLGGEEKRINAG
jgi:hypothetical protein